MSFQDWLTFDWLALFAFILSVVSIYLGIWEARRNHQAMVDLVEVRSGGTQSLDENAGKSFSHFTIVFRNVGIPIRAVTVWLTFYVGRGLHEIQIGALPADTEVPKGFIFPCQIKDYEIEQLQHGSTMLQMFGDLTDPRLQRAQIEIRSQGYVVKQINCWGVQYWIRHAPRVAKKFWHWLLSIYLRIQAWGLTGAARAEYLRQMSDKWHVTCFEHEGKLQVMGWNSNQTVDWAIQCFCQDMRQNKLSFYQPSDAG